MNNDPGPRLSLGPIQYFWSSWQVHEFYEQVADWPVDIVYLGENVCAKRRALRLDDWLAVADKLSAAGKEVVLSSLVLLEAESELSQLRRVCADRLYPVEANDMSAVRMLAGKAPFVAGSQLNCYNGETLSLLTELGAYRWLPPVELSAETIEELQACRTNNVQTEVQVFGRLPLAYSARCFTARAYNLPKDDCQFRCQDHPDGLMLYTQEDEALFVLNGIQIQSAVPCNLLASTEQLADMNVDVLRISPLSQGTGTVVEAFRAALDRRSDRDHAGLLNSLSPNGWCNGYWYGEAGMNWNEG